MRCITQLVGQRDNIDQLKKEIEKFSKNGPWENVDQVKVDTSIFSYLSPLQIFFLVGLITFLILQYKAQSTKPTS